MRATVLGSGIVGLWTAELLSRAGHDVSVVTRALYQGTTSAAAVCVLTPFFPGDPTSAAFQRGVRWAAETLEHFKYLDDGGRFLELMPCYEFGLDGMLEADFPVSKLDYLDFTSFNIVDLDAVVAECNFAVGFTCYLCNTSVFLPWLYDLLVARGVSFRIGTIVDRKDVDSLPADIVFNCLGYQSVFPDEELFPVSGQSMFIPVDSQPQPHFGIGAGHHAIFKHRRGFYLGSYFIPGASDTPRAELYQQSLDFAEGPYKDLCKSVGLEAPAIDLSAVTRVNSGIRPFRRSGPRVAVDTSLALPVVHNYGHGAHGWTVGYASAVEAVQLVGDLLDC